MKNIYMYARRHRWVPLLCVAVIGTLMSATDTESIPLSDTHVREVRSMCDRGSDCLVDIDEHTISQQLCPSAECVSMYDTVFKKSAESSDAYVVSTCMHVDGGMHK